MELAVEVTCYAVGCRVGYGSPGTLTPKSLKMLETTPPQLGDAGLLGPTLFVAAPAVLDKVLIAVVFAFAVVMLRQSPPQQLGRILYGATLPQRSWYI